MGALSGAGEGGGPLRVAVVGTGSVAHHSHLPALREQGGRVEVVAVLDTDRARAAEFAAHWGIPAVHHDLAELLDRARPDLVVVCTPPHAHPEPVAACLDAGAWVWCEKPPARSLAEYDAMAAHERDGGPYVSYVFQQRYGSAARALREEIRDGALGPPLVGVCHTLWYRGEDYYAIPWHGRWETEGGGPTMGLGVHQMDLMLWLLGPWTEVRAASATLARPIATEDVSMAIARFASGAMVSVVNSALSPRQTSYLRLDFRDATVELSHLYGYDNSNWTRTPAPHRAGQALAAPAENTASSHAAQLRLLLEAVRDGRRPEAGAEDGRRALEFVAALYQSAATGRAVTPSSLTPGNPFYHSMKGPG